jgi:hypothetical protein
MIDHLFDLQEAIMKFGSLVVCIMVLSVLVFSGQPAWSQETTQDETRMEAQPVVTDEAQPAAADETQAVVPDESQPTSPSDSQTASPSESQSAVRIPEAVVCQDVVDRAPVGAGDAFAKEVPRVYCFTHVVDAAPGTQLIHNWYYQGNLKASVDLTVGSSDFRTWSYKTMMPQWTGEWMVEILSANGTPLVNIVFVLK